MAIENRFASEEFVNTGLDLKMNTIEPICDNALTINGDTSAPQILFKPNGVDVPSGIMASNSNNMNFNGATEYVFDNVMNTIGLKIGNATISYDESKNALAVSFS